MAPITTLLVDGKTKCLITVWLCIFDDSDAAWVSLVAESNLGSFVLLDGDVNGLACAFRVRTAMVVVSRLVPAGERIAVHLVFDNALIAFGNAAESRTHI